MVDFEKVTAAKSTKVFGNSEGPTTLGVGGRGRVQQFMVGEGSFWQPFSSINPWGSSGKHW